LKNFLILCFLAVSCCCHSKSVEVENKEKIEAPLPAPVDKSKAFSIYKESRMAVLTLNREHFDPRVTAVEATYHDIFYGIFPFKEDIYIALSDYSSNILILVGIDEKSKKISTETFDLTKMLRKINPRGK